MEVNFLGSVTRLEFFPSFCTHFLFLFPFFLFLLSCHLFLNDGQNISILDSLTNYHTSGDDQDLDDRIIRQLWEENKELREEVSQLRKSSGDDADEGRKPTRIFKWFYAAFWNWNGWKGLFDHLENAIGPGAMFAVFIAHCVFPNHFFYRLLSVWKLS